MDEDDNESNLTPPLRHQKKKSNVRNRPIISSLNVKIDKIMEENHDDDEELDQEQAKQVLIGVDYLDEMLLNSHDSSSLINVHNLPSHILQRLKSLNE